VARERGLAGVLTGFDAAGKMARGEKAWRQRADRGSDMDIRGNVLQVLLHFARPLIDANAAQTYAGMGEHLAHMRGRWIARQPVNYGTQLQRLAFLCSHVPVNADSLAWIMEA
jgi:hypothetical protein